ncbi:MAG: hypothetical protein FWD23_01565 [Oscillospiraceae bacterium]|nr:hypothetical protein [Oscillospiraceae bacterium]
MHPIYKDCPYCFQEITKKPILDRHQGRFSIRCPHCLSHRSEWVAATKEAIISWNTYMREDNPNIFYIPLPKPIEKFT